MITFDTLKFSFPAKHLKRIQKQCFENYTSTHRDYGLKRDKLIVQRPIIGVKDICIDKIREMATIELSAKILKDRYIDNLNTKSFIEALEIIKKTDLFYFNTDNVVQDIQFHRVDCSKNIFLQSSVTPYINSLSYIVNSNKYNFQNYKNQSVTFCKNPLSKRRRLRFIFYDKFNELKRDKIFCNYDNVNRYQNILRFEITLNNYFLMRKYLNLDKSEPLNCTTILENQTNVFKETFLELYNSSESFIDSSIINSDKKKLSDIEKELGKKEICKSFDYDFKKVAIFLRNNVKGNISKYYTDYKQICLLKNSENNSITNNFFLNQIYKNVA
jgi:hypothetical protein